VSKPLADRRVWLTRPAGQNTAWADALTAAGAVVKSEPLLEIVPPQDAGAALGALVRAESADWTIACSTNAVQRALALRPGFAPSGRLAAVGSATGAALERATGREVVCPARFDADAVLDMPELQSVAGQFVSMLAGEGGRTRLANELAARGAQVEKIAAYRRIGCNLSKPKLAGLVEWANTIIVTSGDALAHFCHLLLAAGMTRDCLSQLWVPSERSISRADNRIVDTQDCHVLPAMQPDSIVDALAKIEPTH